ncbi:MAG TPA: malonyl-CoA decarboxylase N-terminal domain-containing protein, partial [Vicinamibacterales bacterium]|nr:malonyl-CoA decarboxylase N-terminal domain-containing protein [Vicinamibacterales bacterium]
MSFDLTRLFRSRNPGTGRLRNRRSGDVDRTIELCRALLSERGEVSGARLAAEVLAEYQRLSDEQIDAFFDRLAETFSVDPDAVRQAAAAYQLDASPAALFALQKAVESPRQELFRRCNMAAGGTAILVELRRRLLRSLNAHPRRVEVDADLRHLFKSWFNRGFLTLARID